MFWSGANTYEGFYDKKMLPGPEGAQEAKLQLLGHIQGHEFQGNRF